jgi:hypothetical protein
MGTWNMALASLKAGIAGIVLSVLGGCSSSQRLADPDAYLTCPLNFHAVAHPNNPDPNKAYSCAPNHTWAYGYGGAGSKRKTIAPQ